MFEHIGTWNRELGGAFARLDLWDTGRSDSYGKSELRYALAIMRDDECGAVIIEGEDYYPSPMLAVDSDESAGALLSFFSAYGESIRYSGEDADVPEFTAPQRDVLETWGEELAMWSNDLEGEQ